MDDLADACEFFLKRKTKHSIINIGAGKKKSILEFAKFIMKKLNVDIKIKFDKKKPNGTPRKRLNISLAKNYGWESKISLEEGFNLTYDDFLNKWKTW